MGYLSDRTGKRMPFIIGGLAANAIGDAGMALLSTPWMLVFWRGVHGIGAASFVPLSVYFAAFFRPENATRATALMIALTSGTQVFVSLLGGKLADTFGVTSTFLGGRYLRRGRGYSDGRGGRAPDTGAIARCRSAASEGL